MKTIPGVFGAFLGDFFQYSSSHSKIRAFLRKTKNQLFSPYLSGIGLDDLPWCLPFTFNDFEPISLDVYY